MGLDPQGIPWNNLDTSRVEYRKSRLENYMNYENLRPEQRPASAAALQAEISSHHVESDAQFFEFESNERQLRSSIVHFQLRNLVWSTSSHDVLVTHINEIVHYGYHSGKATPVREPNHLSKKKHLSLMQASPRRMFWVIRLFVFGRGKGAILTAVGGHMHASSSSHRV